MLKNGVPMSIEGEYKDTDLMDLCTEEEREAVYDWIGSNIIPRKSPLKDRTSYGIKHILQRQTGIYLTNNQFKDAMLHCGYEPVNPDELNWYYCISKKSPAFEY